VIIPLPERKCAQFAFTVVQEAHGVIPTFAASTNQQCQQQYKYTALGYVFLATRLIESANDFYK
jgi:hypothetical protein